MTTYTPTHTVGDLSDITIDLTVEGLLQVLNFIGLIVLIVLFGWFMKKAKSAGFLG